MVKSIRRKSLVQKRTVRKSPLRKSRKCEKSQFRSCKSGYCRKNENR